MAQSLNEPKRSFLLTWMQSSKHQRMRRLLTVWSSSRSADAKSCPPWLNFWKYPKLQICATITFYRIFFIFMCMGFCLHVCMHNTCVQCSGRSEKSIRCHQTGVTDGYEQSVLWVLGTEHVPLHEQPVFLTFKTISPAPLISLYLHCMICCIHVDIYMCLQHIRSWRIHTWKSVPPFHWLLWAGCEDKGPQLVIYSVSCC